ncbi:MAG: O-antigen ligase family protein [Campylobacterota bacterium]|nr:O-antigen ligase family protein [Campylobacterota bacterium]
MNNTTHLDYTKYINYVAVAYALVFPLSRAGISFFTALLLLLWLLEGGFKRKLSLMLGNTVVLSLFAFLAFNLISLLWTNHLTESFDYIRRYWYLSVILVLFTSIQKDFIPKILSFFILGMFISEVISYGVFFEWWEFKHATTANISPFMHHIEYSVYLALAALIIMGRIFSHRMIKTKLIYIVFFITMSGNLFLTEGRTGQLALVFGLLTLALVNFKNKFKAFFLSSVISLTLLSAAYVFSDTFQHRVADASSSLINVINNQDYCSSWGARVGAYITAKDIVVTHPIVGVGITDNMDIFRGLLDTKYQYMACIRELEHMHNQYLQILTQLGFLGLFIFISIFYNLGNIKIKNREFRNIKYVYLAILFVGFIAEVLFHRAFSLALYSVMVGLILAQNRVENEV